MKKKKTEFEIVPTYCGRWDCIHMEGTKCQEHKVKIDYKDGKCKNYARKRR